jgi:hypothetical protein
MVRACKAGLPAPATMAAVWRRAWQRCGSLLAARLAPRAELV